MKLALAAIALAACGAATPAPTSVHTPAPGEWATWSHDQKKTYMEEVVLPDAKKMFAVYDPVRYKDVTCKTCHGAGVDDGTYHMPNPALPALVPTRIYELAGAKPQLFIFMDGWVQAHMARLLAEPTFDHMTMSGFGCFKCHTAQK